MKSGTKPGYYPERIFYLPVVQFVADRLEPIGRHDKNVTIECDRLRDLYEDWAKLHSFPTSSPEYRFRWILIGAVCADKRFDLSWRLPIGRVGNKLVLKGVKLRD